MAKQRLVGTVVLIALAVIFIPMILDFSREQETVVVDIDIPPAPDANTMRVLPLNTWSKKIDPELKAEPLFVEPTVAMADEEKQIPEPAPKEVAVVTAQEVPAPVATKKIAEKAKAWAVQIGSFSSQEKAQAFRDRLHNQGYSVYVISANSREQKKYHRVRIGPIELKSEALSIQKKLKTDTQLDGLLMRY